MANRNHTPRYFQATQSKGASRCSPDPKERSPRQVYGREFTAVDLLIDQTIVKLGKQIPLDQLQKATIEISLYCNREGFPRGLRARSNGHEARLKHQWLWRYKLRKQYLLGVIKAVADDKRQRFQRGQEGSHLVRYAHE